MSILVEYQSNNSGGSWWLKDEDWRALEAAGWRVHWATLDNRYVGGDYERDAEGFPVLVPLGEGGSTFARMGIRDGRYMGALAKRAFKKFDTPADAMREFERVTSQDVSDEGCNCCGAPHCFSWDGGYASGSDCIKHLYERAPKTLREAAELLSKEPQP